MNSVKKISDNSVSIEGYKGGSFDGIMIYNVLGNLVKSQTYKQVPQANVDVSDLPDGSYIVEIISGGSKQQQKIVIQKK
jgi:hypothetical protein